MRDLKRAVAVAMALDEYSPDVAPTTTSDTAKGMAQVCCPEGHELEQYQTDDEADEDDKDDDNGEDNEDDEDDSLRCDSCNLKLGTSWFGCSICNFDLCKGCWQTAGLEDGDEVEVRVSLLDGREVAVPCPVGGNGLGVLAFRRRVAAAAALPAPPRFLLDGGALLRHGQSLLWGRDSSGSGFVGPGCAAALVAFGGVGYHDDELLDQ
jgi:hypothetical protein